MDENLEKDGIEISNTSKYIYEINKSYEYQNKEEEDEVKEVLTEDKLDLKKELLDWSKRIAICFLAAVFINTFIIVNANVPSGSMENTIMTGDRLFANRLAYAFSDPERFDIVVFKFPDNREKLYVKRIIGLPGDTVSIIDGAVYINGEVIDEPYIKEPFYGSFGTYNVPEGHYFVLGDNRRISVDSRSWENTFVPEKDIVAQPIIRYLPSFKYLVNK